VPINLKQLLVSLQSETEFDVDKDDFADLEIRQEGPKFHYFYDSRARRLIKSFALSRGPQVDTMCGVILIKNDDVFSPRLTVWKKDKTKGNLGVLTEEALVAEGRTVLIKARVDLGDCHENYWKLIDFLRTYRDIDLPEHEFRVTTKGDAELAQALAGHDKEAVLRAVKTYLGTVTEGDVQMLLDRRAALSKFARLLSDPDFFEEMKTRHGTTSERLWQRFFENNTWIFGYGLTLVACDSYSDERLEQTTTGAGVFTGGGKRTDALMRTRGFVQTLLFAEIKTHTAGLLMPTPYRPPDVFQISRELSGAIAQVQKTAHKAIARVEDLHRAQTPGGAFVGYVFTVRPRQVVVIGNLAQLSEDDEINTEMMGSFELFRKSQSDVEIITFDELFERARFIVESHEIGDA